jgi:hypothetical protein
MKQMMLAMAAAPILLTGCTLSGTSTPGSTRPTSGNVEPSPGETSGVSPFRATELRVHALTHVDAAAPSLTPGGKPRCVIQLHFELRDRFGDQVKSTGVLHVELAKPPQSAAAGMDISAAAWDVPEFANADENFKSFDLATRTYRIQLNAPPWVCEEGAKRTGTSSSGDVKLRVSLRVPGDARVLHDEYTVP